MGKSKSKSFSNELTNVNKSFYEYEKYEYEKYEYEK
jgi:hypothetical protein